jgi:hypothetical protein
MCELSQLQSIGLDAETPVRVLSYLEKMQRNKRMSQRNSCAEVLLVSCSQTWSGELFKRKAWLKARSTEQDWAVARQRFGKHAPVAKDTQAKIEKLLKALFYMRSAPTLYMNK